MPILDANALEFFTNSAEQTRRIGIQLGALLKANDVICLEGELGAGKTTLMQGIAADCEPCRVVRLDAAGD